MKLQSRLLLTAGAILILLTLVSVLLSYYEFDRLVDDEMAEEARNVRALLMATRRVYHKQFIDSGLPVTDKTVGFLPAYALSRISQDFPNWASSGMFFNNVSDHPRNPANQADSHELAAMDWFRANPGAKEHIGEITGADGTHYYHYTAPMWIEEYCLTCHGRREAAPQSIREKYTESYNYQLGNLRGVMSIKIPLTSLRERIWLLWRWDAFYHLAGYLLLFLAFIWMIRKTVTRRLLHLEATARQLAAGDYSHRTEQGGKDEIGTLATSLNQMAEAVQKRDNDLRRFAEVTAHHLQEPARRMASYAERLGKQLDGKLADPEINLSLDFIVAQARRQQELLGDVERYLAADQPRGKVEQTDAAVVVARALDKISDRLTASGACVVIGVLPQSRIDNPRLGDIFTMLLDNALRYGAESPCWPEGASPPPVLQITIEGKHAGAWVRYCVSDNGPNIEEKYRERVFRVFERLHPSEASGTGIGLAIVRRIVESCGGRAWIEENAGGGCRVVFELPSGEIS